jgi:hypothetical protein
VKLGKVIRGKEDVIEQLLIAMTVFISAAGLSA